MAAARFNVLCGEPFEARGAGLEPGARDPLAVRVMKEEGSVISRRKTRNAYDLLAKMGRGRFVSSSSMRNLPSMERRDASRQYMRAFW